MVLHQVFEHVWWPFFATIRRRGDIGRHLVTKIDTRMLWVGDRPLSGKSFYSCRPLHKHISQLASHSAPRLHGRHRFVAVLVGASAGAG